MSIASHTGAAAVILTLTLLAAPLILPGPAQARSGGALQTGPSAESTLKNRPLGSNNHLLGRFDPRDHTRQAPNPFQPAQPSVFLDMDHQVEVEMEVWHGSAGLKLIW